MAARSSSLEGERLGSSRTSIHDIPLASAKDKEPLGFYPSARSPSGLEPRKRRTLLEPSGVNDPQAPKRSKGHPPKQHPQVQDTADVSMSLEPDGSNGMPQRRIPQEYPHGSAGNRDFQSSDTPDERRRISRSMAESTDFRHTELGSDAVPRDARFRTRIISKIGRPMALKGLDDPCSQLQVAYLTQAPPRTPEQSEYSDSGDEAIEAAIQRYVDDASYRYREDKSLHHHCRPRGNPGSVRTTMLDFDQLWKHSDARSFMKNVARGTDTYTLLWETYDDAVPQCLFELSAHDQGNLTMSPESCGLAIMIWLIVVFKAHQNRAPSRRMPIWDICSTMWLAAATMAETRLDPAVSLLDMLKVWNMRLQDAYTTWHTVRWWTSIPLLVDILFKSPTDTVAQQYENIIRGYRLTDFVKLVIQRENNGTSSPIKHLERDHEETLMRSSKQLFMSMRSEVLLALIRGKLPAYKGLGGEHVIKTELSRNASRGDSVPAIYANAITDRAGIAPTACQWRQIVRHVERYIKSSKVDLEWAMHIDAIHNPREKWTVKRTIRRYTAIWTESGGYKICIDRVRKIQDFCTSNLRLVNEEIDKGREHCPLPRAPMEFGYSKAPFRRLKVHASHGHSHFLMTLVHAIAIDLFDGALRLNQFIVFSCWHSVQPWLGETYFARICQTYSDQLGGLTYYQAGRSNRSGYEAVGQNAYDSVIADGEVLERRIWWYEHEIASIKADTEAIKRARASPHVPDGVDRMFLQRLLRDT